MTLRRVGYLTSLAAVLCLAQAPTSHATDGAYVTRAVFGANRLWLLSETGTLSSIDEGAHERVDWSLPDFVLDLWTQDGAPTVLTGKSGGRHPQWQLLRWDGSRWTQRAQIDSRGDGFVGARSYRGTTTILTRERLINIDGRRQRVVEVSPSWASWWRLGGNASIAVNRDSVLVGINNGEWGGGLKRVDRKTGAISEVGSQFGDPVTAMTAEPGKDNCAVVSVGLVHMLSNGGIYEVCGDTVRLLYSKPYRPAAPPGMVALSTDADTVAFFGVSAVGRDLWAAGIDGVYKLGTDGTTVSVPLPKFQRIGGTGVSFEVPQVVLVTTDVNTHKSLSGTVPLLVSRTD